MKTPRAIIAGVIVWTFIIISFVILGFVPALKNAMHVQALIVAALIIPFAVFGASFYYKSGSTGSGLALGLVMSLTALCLDALITVPFMEIPNGGSYQSFYTYPLLWLLVAVNTLTVYAYQKRKVRASILA